MANDVANTLAAAATGGGAKVVDITLKLRADPANSAVIKRLSEQVNDAARQASQEIETVTQKLVASTNRSAKSIGDAMTKAFERVAAKHTETSAKMEAEHKASSEAFKRRIADAERDWKRLADTEAALTKRAEQNSIQSVDRVHEHRRKKAAEKREEQLNTGLKQFGEVASEAGGLVKDLALAIAPKEAAEQLAKSLEKFDHVFGIFEHGLKVFAGINEALVTMKKFAAAAAVEQRLLAAAQVGAGAAVGGGSSTATIFGEGALASAGSTATIASVGALVASAGIAVSDILGKLTGKYETLTGLVTDWVETTKRNAELEKSIERQQQAREWRVERLKQQAEQTQKYFEGRERIAEAQRRQGAVGGSFNRLEYYIGQPHGDTMNVGNKGDLELQARAEEAVRRRMEQNEREHEAAQAAQNYLAARNELDKTLADNARIKESAEHGQLAINLGPSQNRFPTAEERRARQQEIDKAEEATQTGGFRRALASGLFGVATYPLKIGSLFSSTLDTKYDRWKTGYLHSIGIDPTGRPASGAKPATGLAGLIQTRPVEPDISKQQALEAELVKRAQELYAVRQKNQEALLSELSTMHQQIQASREKVAAAKEGVRVAQEQANAQKAGYAISMSKADQQIAVGILNELKSGKNVGRDKLLFLKHKNLDIGPIGAAINAQLAKDLNPEFAAALKRWGIEDDLTKKQNELAGATEELKERFLNFEQTLKNAIGNLFEMGLAGIVGGKAVGQAEQTKAYTGGHQDPNQSEGRVRVIEKESKAWAKAVEEMEHATIEAIRGVSAKGREAAQRIKETHA